jgi:hypothetical protein
VDLGLDDPDRPTQLLRGNLRLDRRKRDPAPWHGYAKLGKQPFSLIFVDIHSLSILIVSTRVKGKNPPFGRYNLYQFNFTCKHRRLR